MLTNDMLDVVVCNCDSWYAAVVRQSSTVVVPIQCDHWQHVVTRNHGHSVGDHHLVVVPLGEPHEDVLDSTIGLLLDLLEHLITCCCLMQRLDFEDVGKQLQVHDVVGGEFNFHKTCCLRQSCCHTRPQSCWIQSCCRGI